MRRCEPCGSWFSGSDTGDDLNVAVQLLLAKTRKTRQYVHAIAERFALQRPKNYGIYLRTYYQHHRQEWKPQDDGTVARRIREGISRGWKPDCPTVLGAFRWYFRSEAGGSPGLAELYEPIIRRHLAGPIPILTGAQREIAASGSR